MKLDILAFGAHPDDVELGASGTLLLHINKGYKCGIIDFTKGELGTRGSAEIRSREAENASKLLGIHVRENLNMDDGFFLNDKDHQLAIVAAIRKYRPEVVFANAKHDRHPDHGRAALLVAEAIFLSGLIKIETKEGNTLQERWKVKALYHYIQDRHIIPDLAVDVTAVWERKMKSIMAFSSQFYNAESAEPETPISGEDFIHFLEARAIEMGRPMGVKYAEGFLINRTPGVKDFFDLI